MNETITAKVRHLSICCQVQSTNLRCFYFTYKHVMMNIFLVYIFGVKVKVI